MLMVPLLLCMTDPYREEIQHYPYQAAQAHQLDVINDVLARREALQLSEPADNTATTTTTTTAA